MAEGSLNDRSQAAFIPLAVLSAIGAGLGGLAFFTFIGGAITAARFRGASLSGTKTVALVPKADLLAVGAQALLVPCFVALVAMAIFVLVFARNPLWRRVYLACLAVGGLVLLSIWTPYKAGWWFRKEDAAAFLLLLAVIVAGGLAVDYLAPSRQRSRTAAILQLPPGSHSPVQKARSRGSASGRPRNWRRPRSWVDRIMRWLRAESGSRGPTSRAPAAALFFLVVALAGTVAYYGVCFAHPSLHPMAVLRTGDGPLCGVYVSDSADAVWIAQVPKDESLRDIVEIPRSAVAAVAIGKTRSLAEAQTDMQRLLTELSISSGRPAPPPACP